MDGVLKGARRDYVCLCKGALRTIIKILGSINIQAFYITHCIWIHEKHESSNQMHFSYTYSIMH